MATPLFSLIDRVIAWIDRVSAPQPKLIPIPVRAGKERNARRA